MKNQTNTINGFYGSNHTPCTIYTFDGWYCIDGSVNVNRCDPDLLIDGVDVETLPDYDMFTAGGPIKSEEELEAAVNGADEPEEEQEEEELSPLESLVNNVVNGNLQTALRQADDFNVYQVREALQEYAGYSFKKAVLTAEWLESGQNYQRACDAE